ncbi:MAG: ComEC/Rec2 family competence protein, partial [Blautia sp.]|nr:ComEC/Rec2 family competence protein [Blautia sp.]
MLRQRCAGIFSLCAAEDAPLFDALLLGDKSLLTEETKTKFQLAGIIHLLAISGLHISLVGVSISRLLGFLGLGFYVRNSLCLLLVLSFGMLTGGSVSTLRAVSSYLLSVGAKGAGRS